MANFKEKLVQRVDDIYRNSAVKSRLHPEWHTALSFYEGNHWRKYDQKLKKFKDMFPQELKKRITVNRIEKIVTTFVAHFLKEMPTIIANPNSNTPDDVNAAELSQQVAQNEYIPKLERVLTEYFYWKYITGTGIRGLFYDPNASAQLRLPIYDEQGIEIARIPQEIEGVGQLYLKAINPFNFYPVGGSSIEDCTEILYVESLPVDRIKDLYNVSEVTPESVNTDSVTGKYPRDIGEFEQETFEDRAKVYQYWRRKSGEFKKGLYAVIINGKIRKYGDNPYVKYSHPYPFFKSSAIPIPGKFWGKSPVELLRKIQISSNYVYTQIIQYVEKMGKAKWWIPRGSNVAEESISTKMGEVSYYTAAPGTHAPMSENLKPLPYYFFQLLDYFDKAFEDISGFHEVKSARLPTGANNPSGVMVNLLLEQDETRLTPAIKEYTNSVKREAKLYLEMVQDHYDEPRMLKIGGPETETLIRDFRGAMLSGNTDVKVELAPILSESRAAWEQTLSNALQIGAIDPRTYLQKMKLEHPKQMKDMFVEEALANRENNEMRFGQMRNVLEFHVDEIHLPIHETFMKTKTFENLNEQIQALFWNHREAHLKNQAAKFEQKMAAQQQQTMANQPPPPPGQGGQVPPM